jgi:glycosyltransferase involved in cell wall biosynthesis
MKRLLILGTRGIPAAHGGFETFAEQLSLYLTRRGWDVSVYCQEGGAPHGEIREELWHGVRRILVPARSTGSAASLLFDWRCIRDAARKPGRLLILGYNTALFNLAFRVRRRPFMINMDGIEWRRPKWALPIKVWFWVNEQIAGRSATTLIADNPGIESYLQQRFPSARIVMIPYGAPRIEKAPVAPLGPLHLVPNRYYISICRIEPDNSVLEIVQAFSAAPRLSKFCVIGSFQPQTNKYHRAVQQAAGVSVTFPGAIRDWNLLASLRFHARAYCHGHRFGGTNPSLVEALGAGNAIIAQDNRFNRWTAGDGQFYFKTYEELRTIFDHLDNDERALSIARAKAVQRFSDGLTWQTILAQYEDLISRSLPDN